jgi:serine protease Do
LPVASSAASQEQPGQEQHEPDEPETMGRADASDLGLELAPAGSITGAGEQGVVVLDINPAGLWAEQGFSLGDVILEVSGKSVKTPEELGSAVSDARNAGKRILLLRLRSGDAMRFVTAPLG